MAICSWWQNTKNIKKRAKALFVFERSEVLRLGPSFRQLPNIEKNRRPCVANSPLSANPENRTQGAPFFQNRTQGRVDRCPPFFTIAKDQDVVFFAHLDLDF